MNFWAWGGKYIGVRYEDILYSYKGTPIGRFENNILFDFNGKYIGEIMQKDRLIVNNGKTHLRSHVATKPSNIARTSYANYAGYAMYAGYSDFNYVD